MLPIGGAAPARGQSPHKRRNGLGDKTLDEDVTDIIFSLCGILAGSTGAG